MSVTIDGIECVQTVDGRLIPIGPCGPVSAAYRGAPESGMTEISPGTSSGGDWTIDGAGDITLVLPDGRRVPVKTAFEPLPERPQVWFAPAHANADGADASDDDDGDLEAFWVGLLDKDGCEVKAPEYRRVAAAFHWGAELVNAEKIEFPMAQSNWGEIAGVGLFCSRKGGEIHRSWPLSGGQVQYIPAQVEVSFSADALAIGDFDGRHFWEPILLDNPALKPGPRVELDGGYLRLFSEHPGYNRLEARNDHATVSSSPRVVFYNDYLPPGEVRQGLNGSWGKVEAAILPDSTLIALTETANGRTPGQRAMDDFATIRASMAKIREEASPRFQAGVCKGADLDMVADRAGLEPPRKEGEMDYTLKDRIIAHLDAVEKANATTSAAA